MNILTRAYQGLIYLGSLLKSPLLLLLRLFFGLSFMTHGWQKLMNIPQTAESFAQLNIPMPLHQAYLVGSVEFFCGLLLAIGLASRLAAIPLATTMIVAFITAHFDSLSAIFTDPSRFIAEPAFNYLLTALLVLAFGPGRFSVDHLLERRFFRTA